MSTTPMTPERLAEVQARLDASSWSKEEPWAVWDDGYTYAVYAQEPGPGIVYVADNFRQGKSEGEADAMFVAEAPQDLSDLLAEVERLRALTTVDDTMVERSKRAFGVATAQVSSSPLGMSEAMFIDSVGLQHQHAIRAALDAALGTGEGS